jgi:6-pyruvoyl-tetrahydropterin synthase
MSSQFVIKKSFHFHAAHRNEDLPDDRCFSIHGHTYYLDCHFGFEKSDEASVTMLFSDIERSVLPAIEPFEHALIINNSDPLYDVLKGVGIKLCVLEHPSSAENLAKLFFERIKSVTNLNLLQVDLKETTSSVVSFRG